LPTTTDQNAAPRALTHQFPIHLPYDLLNEADIHAPFVHDVVAGWEVFNRRYPESRGYLTMSAVGFSADKSRALLYFSHSCGCLCGAGRYEMLEKVDGVWRPARLNVETCMWIS
jgi:hypothetical protein